MTVDVRAFDALVGAIYEAAHDDHLWPSVLANLAKLFKPECSLIYFLDTLSHASTFDGGSGVLSVDWGFRLGALQQHAEHFTYVNVWQKDEHLPRSSDQMSRR